ncbi:MAG: DUF4238 domain-containing protein [Bdellovibrio sp.]|nr:DUF4238 domain-containing protein [Bdellovibrio sp.]
MSEPRRHHYCPQFYLAAFTEDGTKDSRLWVIDKLDKKVRSSKPKNEAHQRDFYRVEVPGDEDPFALEKEFSKIETEASSAIQHIVQRRALPDNNGMGYLLSFIGLLAVRTPWHRAHVGGFMETVAKRLMDVVMATRERWEVTKRRMKESGHDVPDDVTYEQMADFIQRDQYRVEVDQNYQLSRMLKSAHTITNLLIRRNWMIVLAEEGELVSSDNPVGLSWSKPMAGWYPPGFGLSNTEVSVPLSKTVGLIGIFEPAKLPIGALKAEGVATFNNQAISRATRFIYSPKDDFTWRPHTGEVLNREAFFQRKPDSPQGNEE